LKPPGEGPPQTARATVLTVSAVPGDVTPKSLTDQKRKLCGGAITPLTAAGFRWLVLPDIRQL
jgi:hypothetical protein